MLKRYFKYGVLVLILIITIIPLTACGNEEVEEEKSKRNDKVETEKAKRKEATLDADSTFTAKQGISQWTIKLNDDNTVYGVLVETGIQDYFGTYEIKNKNLIITFTEEGSGAGEDGDRFPLSKPITHKYEITNNNQFEGDGLVFKKITNNDETISNETVNKVVIDIPEKAIQRVREHLKLEEGNPTIVQCTATERDSKGTYYVIQTRASGLGEMPAGALLATFYVYENGDVEE